LTYNPRLIGRIDLICFLLYLKQFRYVTVNEQNWKLSVCSCWYWCKYYKCKHMISTCYRLNLCNLPQEAKQIQIGHNRKRGAQEKLPRDYTIKLKLVMKNMSNQTQTISKNHQKRLKRARIWFICRCFTNFLKECSIFFQSSWQLRFICFASTNDTS